MNEFNIKNGFISNSNSSVNGLLTSQTLKITSGATNGYVLTSDASGNATWSVPSSSSGNFGISNSGGTYTYYTTLSDAISAASAGQTIEVFVDYTENGSVTITLKDGVTINGNGHTYTLTTSSGIALKTSDSVSTSTSILNWNVTCTGPSSSTIYLGTNASGVLLLTGSKFKNTSNSYCISNTANSDFEIIDFVGFSNTATCVSWGSSPNGKLRNSYCYSVSGYGYYGNVRLDNSIFISVSNIGLGMTGGIASDCIGISSGSAGLYCTGGILNNCKGYSSGGAGVYLVYSNAYSCFGYSTSSYGILFENEPCRGYNCFGFSTANNGIRIYRFGTGSDLAIYSSTALSTSATALVWEGYATNMTCISEYNNSNGHAASGANNAIITNSSFTVTNSSANCLYSSSPITQKYTNSSFKGATTSVNANITQGMTNTEDAYGNITI